MDSTSHTSIRGRGRQRSQSFIREGNGGQGSQSFIREGHGGQENQSFMREGRGGGSRLPSAHRRRPVSPVRPGNHVPNQTILQGGYKLSLNGSNCGDDKCEWLEEKVEPEVMSTNTKKNTFALIDGQPEVPYEDPFTANASRLNRLIHSRSENIGLRNLVEFERDQRQEILASLYSSCTNDDPGVTPLPHNKKFIVIDFGVYRVSQYVTMPAEFTIADFSVIDGINSCYSRLLDPKVIPLGYRSEIQDEMVKNGYLKPGFDISFDWDRDCFSHIEMLMNQHKSNNDEPGYLYVMPDNFLKVKECMTWISRGLDREFRFKLMPLPALVHILLTEATHLSFINNIRCGRPTLTEMEVLKLLLNGDNENEGSIGCSFHQLPSRVHLVEYCTANRVKCRIYNALTLLTRYYGCPRFLYNHFPKIEKPEYVSQPVTKKVDIYALNDDRSAVESVSSECPTERFLYQAHGASTISGSSFSPSVFSDDANDSVLQIEPEDDEKVRKRYSTLETYPKLSNVAGAKGDRRDAFKCLPDMKDRCFPTQTVPYNTVDGKQSKVRKPECRKCWQDKCICACSSISGSEFENMDGAYKRYINPVNMTKKMELLSIAPGEKLRNSESEVGSNDLDYSREGGSSVETESDIDRSSTSNSSQRRTPSTISSSSLNKWKEHVKVLEEVRVMQEWQKLLPTTGSSGRGMPRWAGTESKYYLPKEPGDHGETESVISMEPGFENEYLVNMELPHPGQYEDIDQLSENIGKMSFISHGLGGDGSSGFDSSSSLHDDDNYMSDSNVYSGSEPTKKPKSKSKGIFGVKNSGKGTEYEGRELSEADVANQFVFHQYENTDDVKQSGNTK